MSHPFVERLIGSVRRELLDQTFFWTATDLENKLRDYQDYYNEHRCHSSRDGDTPVCSEGDNIVSLNNYGWKQHCRGLFQLPVAAEALIRQGQGQGSLRPVFISIIHR